MKLNRKGLHSIVNLSEAQVKFSELLQTNFVLKHMPQKYPLMEEFWRLLAITDRILGLELSQVTPSNALELLEQANCVKEKTLELLSQQQETHFASVHSVSVELNAFLDAMIQSAQDLVDQSRSNLLVSLEHHLKLIGNPDDVNLCMLRDSAKAVLNANDVELKAQLPTLVFNILKAATLVEPELNKSLSYLNKGL